MEVAMRCHCACTRLARLERTPRPVACEDVGKTSHEAGLVHVGRAVVLWNVVWWHPMEHKCVHTVTQPLQSSLR